MNRGSGSCLPRPIGRIFLHKAGITHTIGPYCLWISFTIQLPLEQHLAHLACLMPPEAGQEGGFLVSTAFPPGSSEKHGRQLMRMSVLSCPVQLMPTCIRGALALRTSKMLSEVGRSWRRPGAGFPTAQGNPRSLLDMAPLGQTGR